MITKRNLPIATFINMLTVFVGSLIGVALQQVFPENIQSIIFQAIGLGTLLIGIKMSLRLPDGYLLIFIFSLILGGVIGELLGVNQLFQSFGSSVKALLNIQDAGFSEGLITAFILFCIGSMTIVGAIEEGIEGKRELLLVKSMLDGITSIALASSFGIGVLFSIFPMLIFQGGITILAGGAKQFLNEKLIAALSTVGGVLIIALSINMLQLGKINIENLLPSLLVIVAMSKAY